MIFKVCGQHCLCLCVCFPACLSKVGAKELCESLCICFSFSRVSWAVAWAFPVRIIAGGLDQSEVGFPVRDQGTVVKVQVLAVQSHGSISGFAAYVLQLAVDGLSSDWRRGAQEGFVQG